MKNHMSSHSRNAAATSSPEIDSLRTLILEAEEALSNASEAGDAKLSDIKERLQTAMDSTKSTVARWKNNVIEQGKRADLVVRTHPYESVGIALAAGLILWLYYVHSEIVLTGLGTLNCFPASPSLSRALRIHNKSANIRKLAFRSFGHRAELASIELAEARNEAVVSLLLVWGTAALLLLFGIAATLVVAASVWDTPHRVPVLALLSAVYLLGALIFGVIARNRLKAWHPFEATADQLKRDGQCLDELFNK